MKKVMFCFLFLSAIFAQNKVYFLTQNSTDNKTVLAAWDGVEMDSLYDFQRSELVFPMSKLAHDDYYHRIYGFGVNAINEPHFFEYDIVKATMKLIPIQFQGYKKHYNYDLKYTAGHLILLTDSTGTNQNGSICDYNLSTNEMILSDFNTLGVKGTTGYMSDVAADHKIYFFANSGGLSNDGATLVYDVNASQLSVLFHFSSISQFSTNVVLRGPSGAPIVKGHSLFFATNLGGANSLGGVVKHDLVSNESEMLYHFNASDQVIQMGKTQYYQDTLTFLSAANTSGVLPFMVQYDLSSHTFGSKAYFDSTAVATPSGGMDFYEHVFVGLADYSNQGNWGGLYELGADTIALISDLSTSAFVTKGAPLLIDLRSRPELSFDEDTSVTCDGSFVVVPFSINNPSGHTQHHFEVYSDNESVVPPFNAIVSGTFPNYKLNITPLLNTKGIVHLTVVYDNGYDHELHYHTVFVGSYIEIQDSLVFPVAGNDGEIFIDISGAYNQINWSNGIQDTNHIANLNANIYSVIIEDVNQCTFEASFDLINSGWNEWASVEVNIFPNPGSSYFIIENAQTHTLNLNVYDLRGKLLLHQVFEDQLKVDAEEWSPGVYILSLDNGSSIKNYKWIKRD